MNPEDRLKEMFRSAQEERDASESEWGDFRRRAHRRLAVRRVGAAVGTASVLVAAAIGITAIDFGSDEEAGPQPAVSSTESLDPTPEETAAPEVEIPDTEQELWYVQDGRLSWTATTGAGEPDAVVTPSDDVVAHSAAGWLEMLLGVVLGPVAETGGSTAMPEGTKLLSVVREGTTLTVELKTYFDGNQDTPKSLDLAMAQIVYTATQFDGIDAVSFRLQGGADETLTGTRFFKAAETGNAFTRSDFTEVAPPIVLETPEPNMEISSGVEVAGFANVFEANVSIMLTDENDKKLVDTFATATCGTGCWGTFSQAIEFEVDERQEGRLSVLTYSAENGEAQDVISIPVMLVP
jgi:hypothetical protein